MKHLVYGEKSLLVSDEGAEALMEYARLIAELSQTDTVTIPAVDQDGSVVEATVLLTPATHIVIETANSAMDAPDTTVAVAYMYEQTERRAHPPEAQPESADDVRRYDDLG